MGVYPPTPALPIIALVLWIPVIPLFPLAGVKSHLFLLGVTPNERGVFVSTVDHFEDDEEGLLAVLGVAVMRFTGLGASSRDDLLTEMFLAD